MTSPQQFEVYPPAAEAGLSEPAAPEPPAQTWEQPGTEPVVRSYQVTPYQVPDVVPPPSPSGGPSRRGVLGLLIALPVGAVILSAMNSRSNSGLNAWPTDDPYQDDGNADPVGDTIQVGGHSADLPDGWSTDTDNDDEVIVTNGANRLVAYSFTADTADQATDLVSALVKRRFGGFKGTLSDPKDSSDGDAQQAIVTASGTFSKKPAKLTGQLWIDADGDALLVVRILTAKSGSTIAQDAGDMTDALSSDFE